MRKNCQKRFELVISKVLFISVRISLFPHSPNQLYKLEEMSSCVFIFPEEMFDGEARGGVRRER
jgi:hypothetical protein